MNNKTVWCIFDDSDLLAVVDDEDKAILWKRNNPEIDVEIEEWGVK